MKEEKMWDEKVVIRRYFFALSGILLFFRKFAPSETRDGFMFHFKQEFDSLSKDEKNNILLNLKTQDNKK